MARHTPGPWFAYLKSSVIAVGTGKKGKAIDAIVHWTGFDACHVGRSQQIANAKLIAAAPDLLKAAEKLTGYLGPWLTDYGPTDPQFKAFDALHAAISRATK